jgi:hypothetical protein
MTRRTFFGGLAALLAAGFAPLRKLFAREEPVGLVVTHVDTNSKTITIVSDPDCPKGQILGIDYPELRQRLEADQAEIFSKNFSRMLYMDGDVIAPSRVLKTQFKQSFGTTYLKPGNRITGRGKVLPDGAPTV